MKQEFEMIVESDQNNNFINTDFAEIGNFISTDTDWIEDSNRIRKCISRTCTKRKNKTTKESDSSSNEDGEVSSSSTEDGQIASSSTEDGEIKYLPSERTELIEIYQYDDSIIQSNFQNYLLNDYQSIAYGSIVNNLDINYVNEIIDKLNTEHANEIENYLSRIKELEETIQILEVNLSKKKFFVFKYTNLQV